MFASADDEAAVALTNDASRKILTFLGEKGKASRTELTRDCFQGHRLSGQIDEALDALLTTNPPKIVVRSVARAKENPGAPTKYYELTANSAKSANSEYPCGFPDDSGESELCEVRELCSTVDDQSSQVRKVRKGSNPPQTRASVDNSHNSHSSQTDPEKPAEREVIEL